MTDIQVTPREIRDLVEAYDVPVDARDDDRVAGLLMHAMVDPLSSGATILGVCVFTAHMLVAHGFGVPQGHPGFVGMRIVSLVGDSNEVPEAVEHSAQVEVMRMVVALMNNDRATAMALVGAQLSFGPDRAAEIVVEALETYHRMHVVACHQDSHE
jgi:hypothetical protein